MTRAFALSTLMVTVLVAQAQNDIDPDARESATKVLTQRHAPDTLEGWKREGVFQLNLTQVSLTNWAAGGYSSIGGIAQFNGTANWRRGKRAWDNSLALAFGGQQQQAWDNSLALAFGGQQQQDGPTVKTDDRIEVNSKYGRELTKSWYLAALAQFRTQFTEGFDVDGNRISHLLAPGYALLGVGMDYRPNDRLSVYISPATARLVIVTDKTLWGGSTDPGLRVYGVKYGETTEMELGGYLRFQFQQALAENITFLTRGDFFSNYLRDPQNIDITWETLWTFKVNDWFAATLGTVLIYDHDTKLPKTDADGVTYMRPVTQFKQTLGVGLTFKL